MVVLFQIFITKIEEIDYYLCNVHCVVEDLIQLFDYEGLFCKVERQ